MRVAADVLGRVAVTDEFVYFATLANTVVAVLEARRRASVVSGRDVSSRRRSGRPWRRGDRAGYVEAPLPAFSAETGAAAGVVSFDGLLVALPLFTKLPDGRNAAIGVIGGLENKWMVRLQTPPVVPVIPVQPLTVLPGEAVPILPPGL